MLDLLTPPRRRGVEILDSPDIDPAIVTRSLTDVARANALFGGVSSAIDEIKDVLGELKSSGTLLDVGTGLGDIPCRARDIARKNGVELTTIGLDAACELATASRSAVSFSVCGDALRLPFADNSIDIVMCSQVLHHFTGLDALRLLREMNRVARVRVIVSDLRRSWIAAAGLWLVSFPLRFHAVSRHDGVVSVMRGFTAGELVDTVHEAVARKPRARRRRGFRITTSWSPVH
ncbi:MAG TPA: methyltransferase domain-containing protein [Gemmatimonadaceae bacterium]|nr:methyltransferase domain-containing protein [Gemmatimonadaceae bacterium]